MNPRFRFILRKNSKAFTKTKTHQDQFLKDSQVHVQDQEHLQNRFQRQN